MSPAILTVNQHQINRILSGCPLSRIPNNFRGQNRKYFLVPPSRPMSRQNRFQAAAEATVTSREGPSPKANKCRKGYPCPEEGNTYEPVQTERKSSVLCIGCKEKKERSKNYLSYFIWFVVLAIFGGIGWYVYQTYFAADEERKKKEEEDEKKKEAEGKI